VKAYAFEQEVRIIIDRFHEQFDMDLVDNGMSVKVSLRKLLRSIVVAPEAPSWFVKLVQEVTHRYGILAPVRRSKLTSMPL
jgi:hypothetical protein